MRKEDNGYRNLIQELAKAFLRGAARVITLLGNMSNKQSVDLLNHYLAAESVSLFESSEKAGIVLGITPKTIREHSKKPQIETEEVLAEIGWKIFDTAPQFGLTKEAFATELAGKYKEITGKEISEEQDFAGQTLRVLEILGRIKCARRRMYVPIETDSYERQTELRDILETMIEGIGVFTEATCLKIHQNAIEREKESEALHASIDGWIRWSDIEEFKEKVANDVWKLAEVFQQRAEKNLVGTVPYVIQISGLPQYRCPKSEKDLKKTLKGAHKRIKRGGEKDHDSGT